MKSKIQAITCYLVRRLNSRKLAKFTILVIAIVCLVELSKSSIHLIKKNAVDDNTDTIPPPCDCNKATENEINDNRVDARLRSTRKSTILQSAEEREIHSYTTKKDILDNSNSSYHNPEMEVEDVRINNNNNNNNDIKREKTKSYSYPYSLKTWLADCELVIDIHSRSHGKGSNKTLPNFRKYFNTSRIEDVFRLGRELEPYVTAKGENGWKENGIVYRPIRRSRYGSRFEAFIPFNKTFFFGSNYTGSGHINEKEKKIILIYTKPRYMPEIKKVEHLKICPGYPCKLTTDRSHASRSSALVFNGQIIRHRPPKRTSPNQVFVFHNQEPPLYKFFKKPYFKIDMWRGQFNWTMSYRFDSDILSLYGVVRRRPKPPTNKNYDAIWKRKTGLVAWMVSHCDSPGRRQDYVTELQKYIQVDVFGGCGNISCQRSQDDECVQFIARNYKFYLSFENAICTDYVTEKFFRFLSFDLITIVRGNNQFFQHAPSEIFMNTADYSTPEELARAIMSINDNEDLYIRKLQEKDKYVQLYEDYPILGKKGLPRFHHYHHEAIGYCEMCQKLWNLKEEAKVIPDICEWWDRKQCQEPTDLDFLNST